MQVEWIRDTFIPSQQYYIVHTALFDCYKNTWKKKEEIANYRVFGRLLASAFPQKIQRISIIKELYSIDILILKMKRFAEESLLLKL